MLDWITDNLAMIMFVSMFFIIFCGYPVAWVMGGMGLFFAFVGSVLGVFSFIEPFQRAAADVGRRCHGFDARLDSELHLHGHHSRAIRLGQGHARWRPRC